MTLTGGTWRWLKWNLKGRPERDWFMEDLIAHMQRAIVPINQLNVPFTAIANSAQLAQIQFQMLSDKLSAISIEWEE